MSEFASLGQYQSFALIAYEAIRLQSDNVNCARFAGENVVKYVRKLYVAKKLADTVFKYSTSTLSYDMPEQSIINIAGWLQRELLFTNDAIPNLAETYTNGLYDFDPNDFSHSLPNDFS